MSARLWLALVVLALGAAPARAQPPLRPAEANFTLHDVTLSGGGKLDLLQLHYTTLGVARRDAAGRIDNAVVLLHGTGGTGKSFLAPGLADRLFAEGQVFDPTRVFVILPDGIGAGGSSKPSDGLHARFPRYGYGDQVEMHARLLTAGLGVARARLVLGLSMGGMQTWLWAERHPDLADGFVALGASPAPITGRNMLWREAVMRAIRDDPDWRGGDYDPAHPPHRWLQTAMPVSTLMSGNAAWLHEQAPTREAAVALFDTLVRNGTARDANDTLYAFDSSYDYDPVPDLARITAPFLAVNFADDLLNPPEMGAMEKAMPQLAAGKAVLVPARGTYGHQSLSHPELWANHVAAFMEALPAAPAPAAAGARR